MPKNREVEGRNEGNTQIAEALAQARQDVAELVGLLWPKTPSRPLAEVWENRLPKVSHSKRVAFQVMELARFYNLNEADTNILLVQRLAAELDRIYDSLVQGLTMEAPKVPNFIFDAMEQLQRLQRQAESDSGAAPIEPTQQYPGARTLASVKKMER
jgi:hypothetical protein